MRPTVSLLALAFLAAGVSGAQANLTLPVDQEIGTLTCETRPAARGVGANAVADCTFVSDLDDSSHAYVAVIGQRAQAAGGSHGARLSWRVSTRKGVEGPGILAGSFSDPAEWQVAPQKSVAANLIGQNASLKPIAVEGHDAAKLAKSLAGLELIAKVVVASN